MRAKDCRAKARAALKNHWGTSIGVTLVAVLLGASVTGVSALLASGGGGNTRYTYETNPDFASVLHAYTPWVIGFMLAFGTVMLAYTAVVLLLGGATTLGLRVYNIGLLRGERVQFSTLFSRYAYFGRALLLQLLVGLFSLLWMLLFIVPSAILASLLTLPSLNPVFGTLVVGVAALAASIATYAMVLQYAFASYIMAQDPEIRAMQAIRQSKMLLRGHRMRLFLLHLSFIGWAFLAVLTLGIGLLWLNPYMAAAEAAFYLERTGQLPAYTQADA